MISYSRYSEINFLTAMTWLESVASCLASRRQEWMETRAFRNFRRLIENVTRKNFGAVTGMEQVINRLSTLNQVSIREKLVRILRDNQTLTGGLSEKDIARIIKMRNDIVHRGQVKDETALHEGFAIAREIFARLFLSHIGYRGPYESYVRGYAKREFPPI